MTVEKEIIAAALLKIQNKTLEECAKIADRYRENADAIDRAPSRDAACVMIARDIRALAVTPADGQSPSSTSGK